jgi:hypothetical protein
VPEFSYALLVPLGAPRGRVQTFTEVRLKGSDGKVSRPDGAIVVERGSKTWKALVEVKTGGVSLVAEQVSRYLDLARDHGFNAVVTISNDITARPVDIPVVVDRRKTKRVSLYHLSWLRIVTTAVMEHRHRGVSDPDQAWVLGELIAYLDHENSGASGVQDMGTSWVPVREAVRQGTLRRSDASVRDVALHWEQLLDYFALRLSQDLGREVTPGRGRKQDLQERLDEHAERLVATGELTGALRVPDAVGPIEISADLRGRQVTTTVELQAPKDGRQPTRVNWLLRQLQDAEARLRVGASFANTRETTSVLLGEAREYPSRLLSATDPRREIRSFEVALTRPLGLKNGRGSGSFIGDLRAQLVDFYGSVVQNLSPWQPRAPRLPDVDEIPATPQPEPPPLAVAETRDVGEGTLGDVDTPTEPPDRSSWPSWAAVPPTVDGADSDSSAERPT